MSSPDDLAEIRHIVKDAVQGAFRPETPPPARKPAKPPQGPKTRKVPYEDAVDLLKGAGVRARFDRDKVQDYFDRLPSLVSQEDVVGEDALELYLDVTDDLAAGRTVLILPPEIVRPGPDKLPAAKPQAPLTRPGICMAAMEFMRAASERRPVSKAQIWEHLKARFPQRDPKSLKSTAWRAPYWSEYEYDVRVHKNAKGYWLSTTYEGPIKRLPEDRRKKVARPRDR